MYRHCRYGEGIREHCSLASWSDKDLGGGGWHFRGELSIVVVLDWECGVRCHWRLTAGTVKPLFRALLWLMC